MNSWVESFGVLLVAAAGMLIGAWFSRLPKHWWLAGYFLPLILVILFAVGVHYPAIALTPPISWLMLGRTKFAATGFVAAMVLTTPLLKLPGRRDRVAVFLLALSIVIFTSVWPVLAPVFNHDRLAALVTHLDNDGICLQSTDYTCGPAAAVTALHKFGVHADEGEIAILARTTATVGTPPDILAGALQKRYANSGLTFTFRGFKNLAELKAAGLTLVVVKYNLILDHYVTVLSVTDKAVTVGDPLNGLTELTPTEFLTKWRFEGVVVKQK